MTYSKRTIEKWAKSLTSWERGVARLGECIAHFQWVEEALNICISALIGSSRKVGRIVTSEMSYRAKIAVYSSLCHHVLGLNELPEDLRELISRLHWAEQERNALAHSLWGVSEKDPNVVRREKTTSRKGRFVATEEFLTPDELQDLGDLFEGVATDLFYLSALYIPKLKRKLR